MLATSLIFPVEVAVVGVSWHQEQVTKCRVGMHCEVVHEPENPFDANAYAVYVRGELVGHLPKAVAAKMVGGDAGSLEGEIVRVGAGDVVGLRVKLWKREVVTQSRDGSDSAAANVGADVENDPRQNNVTSGDGIESGANKSSTTREESVGAVVRVRASGRVLGELVSAGSGATTVRMSGGVEVRYPTSMVEVVA